jgi:hypothetical protein
LPDDFARAIDFNDSIVELVGYEGIVTRVELALLRDSRKAGGDYGC